MRPREQLYSAVSMIPGLIMAVVLGGKQKFAVVKPAVYAYIITCVASMTYHLRCYSHGFDPRFLRLDLLGQNLGMVTCILSSPLGVSGAMCLAPFSVVSLGLTNLSLADEAFIAEICTVIGVIIACCFKPALFTTWAVAFMFFMIKKFHKNPYTHSLFHLTLHGAMYRYYHALAIV